MEYIGGQEVTVPITEWANQSAVLSTTEMLNQTVKVKYSSNSGQSVNSNTIINFEDLVYDDQSNVTVGASWKFTARKKANYSVNGRFRIAPTSLTGNSSVVASLFKNGSFHQYIGLTTKPTSSTYAVDVPFGTDINLEAGDYIDIRATTNDGAKNLDTLGNYIEVKENPNFSVYSVHGETELVEIQGQPFSFPSFTAGVVQNITSFQFPSIGRWDVTVNIGHRVSSVALSAPTDISTKLSTTGTGSLGTLAYGKDSTVSVFSTSAYRQSNGTFSQELIVTDTSQTYYLRHDSGTNTGATDLRLDFYNIFARKIS